MAQSDSNRTRSETAKVYIPTKFRREIEQLARENFVDFDIMAQTLLEGALGWVLNRRKKREIRLKKARAAHKRWRANNLEKLRKLQRDYVKSPRGKLARLRRPAQIQVRRKPPRICHACSWPNDRRCRYCARCQAEIRPKLVRRSKKEAV